MPEVVLHDYWRSSACYRVRIALNQLGIAYRTVPVDLLKGEQREEEYRALNPQGLVPALEIDGRVLTQSLAIIEYLAETRPEAGTMPADPLDCHFVRTISHAIAMEIHPVCNTHVVAHVMELTGDPGAREAWMRRFIGQGLCNVERLLKGRADRFAFGDRPTMADFCIVPQLYNARRWGADVSGCERLLAIDAECAKLPAFQAAAPRE
ncbi:MAG: maleylacetoacetate isomerase [Rhizobium sp.]|nr:maleylacetoacetate isomerase [Rhizobium sp.]